jgi:hypothetical protein
MPTQGFNIKSLMHDGFKLNVWDIGGRLLTISIVRILESIVNLLHLFLFHTQT